MLPALGLILACAGGNAIAATVVAGQVNDGFSGAAVAGADITVLDGSKLLGHAASDAAGLFRVVFDLEAQSGVKNLKLDVRLSGYTAITKDVVVAAGRTDQNSYQIALISADVSACRRNGMHVVVVGYFRQPIGVTGDLQLSDRIKDSLDYDVLARFQKLKIGPEFQPIFLACEKIEPKADVDYGNYARVLSADAFLSGRVAPEGTAGFQKVKVDMLIGDRYGLLNPPAHATTLNVDLDDPATTRLQEAAQVAIFTALINSYERAAQPSECVEAANAAEQAIGKLPLLLSESRKRCAAALPNAGLIR
jgi:hypothetical protein